MTHYEFQGTLIQCLEYIDEAFGCKDLGCKTRIVIDIDNGKKNDREKILVDDSQGETREVQRKAE
jgi:hypothetical protein